MFMLKRAKERAKAAFSGPAAGIQVDPNSRDSQQKSPRAAGSTASRSPPSSSSPSSSPRRTALSPRPAGRAPTSAAANNARKVPVATASVIEEPSQPVVVEEKDKKRRTAPAAPKGPGYNSPQLQVVPAPRESQDLDEEEDDYGDVNMDRVSDLRGDLEETEMFVPAMGNNDVQLGRPSEQAFEEKRGRQQLVHQEIPLGDTLDGVLDALDAELDDAGKEVCMKCGAVQLEVDDMFCDKCGSRFGGSAIEVEVQAPKQLHQGRPSGRQGAAQRGGMESSTWDVNVDDSWLDDPEYQDEGAQEQEVVPKTKKKTATSPRRPMNKTPSELSILENMLDAEKSEMSQLPDEAGLDSVASGFDDLLNEVDQTHKELQNELEPEPVEEEEPKKVEPKRAPQKSPRILERQRSLQQQEEPKKVERAKPPPRRVMAKNSKLTNKLEGILAAGGSPGGTRRGPAKPVQRGDDEDEESGSGSTSGSDSDSDNNEEEEELDDAAIAAKFLAEKKAQGPEEDEQDLDQMIEEAQADDEDAVNEMLELWEEFVEWTSAQIEELETWSLLEAEELASSVEKLERMKRDAKDREEDMVEKIEMCTAPPVSEGDVIEMMVGFSSAFTTAKKLVDDAVAEKEKIGEKAEQEREARLKKLALEADEEEEKEREEQERKEREEAEEREREEQERMEREEQERREREEQERMEREREERELEEREREEREREERERDAKNREEEDALKRASEAEELKRTSEMEELDREAREAEEAAKKLAEDRIRREAQKAAKAKADAEKKEARRAAAAKKAREAVEKKRAALLSDESGGSVEPKAEEEPVKSPRMDPERERKIRERMAARERARKEKEKK